MLHVSISEEKIMQQLSEKDEKEKMIIEESGNDEELKEYNNNNNNSNLENSKSLNLIEPNNINYNNNIQQQNKNYKNIIFCSRIRREIEKKDKSFMDLTISKINSNSLNESNMSSISNIFELEENQEILKNVVDNLNRGIIPFFIKFEQFAPISIFSQKDVRFIDVIQRIQKQIEFEINSVEFILKGKIIEIIRYYNKTIEELGIEPLIIINAKFKG